MLKKKFLKTALVILVSFFFLTSVAHGYMRMMSDDDLTKIDAENGLTVALGADIYLQAASIGLYTTSAETSGILFPRVIIDEVGNYSSPDAYTFASTSLEMDVGTASGKTWLNISGIRLYNPLAITIGQADGTTGNDNLGINIVDTASGSYTRYIGNLLIRNLFIGRTLTSGTPGYSPPSGNTNTFTMDVGSLTVSGHATQGLDFYVSLSAYMNSLEYRFKPLDSTDEFRMSGIYVCKSFTGSPDQRTNWVGSGSLKIGNFAYNYDPDPSWGYNLGSITTTLYATADVGTLSGKTYLNLNLPMAGSIRIDNYQVSTIDGNNYGFGLIAVDGITMRQVNVMLYNL